MRSLSWRTAVPTRELRTVASSLVTHNEDVNCPCAKHVLKTINDANRITNILHLLNSQQAAVAEEHKNKFSLEVYIDERDCYSRRKTKRLLK